MSEHHGLAEHQKAGSWGKGQCWGKAHLDASEAALGLQRPPEAELAGCTAMSSALDGKRRHHTLCITPTALTYISIGFNLNNVNSLSSPSEEK